jgi:hypothetical protein
VEYTVGAGLPGGVSDAIAAGQCFWYSTAATGIAIAAATTSTVPMIWNPSDSNRNLHIIQINFGYVSGTTVAQHLGWATFLGVGAQFGTAQPIISYTAANPVNALLGAGVASKMKFAPATVSMTVGPTYAGTYGISTGGAQAAGPLYPMIDWTWGKIVIPPGVAFFPAVSGTTITMTASVAVFAWEQPITSAGG